VKSNLGLIVLGETLSDFVEELPFAIAGSPAQYFSKSKDKIKNILHWQLVLRK
jgi:hypothetical protein